MEVRLEIRQDVNNSLWYVWWDGRRISNQGFKFETEAVLFGQGYRDGWAASRQAAVDLIASLPRVV
jgi:hypothetical protein